MSKEQYENVKMEITLFESEDIIVTSDENQLPIIPGNGIGDVSE